MLQPFDFMILSLATFYAAYVLVQTKGPFGYFQWLRENVMHGGLLTCIYCATVWIGGIFYLLWLAHLEPICYVFAGAGAAMLLYRYTGGAHV